MKILLDECVTKKLKPHLPHHNIYTVSEMKWNGLKNGALMTKCTEHGFDILLTIDKNLLHQQNMNKYALTIVVLDCPNSKIETLLSFLPVFNEQIDQLERRRAYIIRK